MADYATVGDFKSWIGLEDAVDDTVIANALTAASAAVDNYCFTHFWNTAVSTARFFDTCDPRWLRINDAAVVAEVATDPNSDGVFETVWAATDFQTLPLNRDFGPETQPITDLSAVGTLTFPRATRRLGLVRVKATWGWPTIPEAAPQSTMLVANRLIKRRRSPEGVAGFDEFGTVRISMRDDPDAARLLTPYRRNHRAGGWAFA